MAIMWETQCHKPTMTGDAHLKGEDCSSVLRDLDEKHHHDHWGDLMGTKIQENTIEIGFYIYINE